MKCEDDLAIWLATLTDEIEMKESNTMTTLTSTIKTISRFPSLPCLHRGNVVSTQETVKAQRKPGVLPIYECRVHGKCVAQRFEQSNGIASCSECQDRNKSQVQLLSNPTDNSRQEKYDVDVFMPYHKNLQYVPASIDSVLWQAGVNPLLHLVNDCSLEDDSFLKAKYKGFENIRWYSTKENVGPYAIANALFYHCETDFIAIRDSDDICSPDSLSLMMHKLIKEGGDLIGGNMSQFVTPHDRGNERIEKFVKKNPYMHSGESVKYFDYPRIINSTMVLTKKTFEELNGFDGDFFCGADTEFVVRAHYNGRKLLYLDKIVSFRRMCENSLSNSSLQFGLGSQYRNEIWDENQKRYHQWSQGTFVPEQWGTLAKSKDAIVPLDISTKTRRGKTYVCIATLPRREYALKKTIESLINQADFIKVYLNGFQHIPDFLKHDKIEIIVGDNSHKGSAKFYWADKVQGYIFTCDDDLIYPADYIEKGIRAIDQYKCICGSHGAKINKGKINNYYQDRVVYDARKIVPRDVAVDIIGTGTICFHTDDIKMSMADMEFPNREDFSILKMAYEKSYKMVVFAHPSGWLKPATGSRDEGLYGEAVRDCSAETQIANEYRNYKR